MHKSAGLGRDKHAHPTKSVHPPLGIIKRSSEPFELCIGCACHTANTGHPLWDVQHPLGTLKRSPNCPGCAAIVQLCHLHTQMSCTLQLCHPLTPQRHCPCIPTSCCTCALRLHGPHQKKGCSLVSTYQSPQGSYKPMQALIRPSSALVCTYKTAAF